MASSVKKIAAPDLSDFRRRYPLTVASLGALANREAWLKNIWELDNEWQRTLANGPARQEWMTKGAPRAGLNIEAEFDIIYAGRSLGLLHAAVMACCYERKVMVFDENAVGEAPATWNLSNEELRELERPGLFTHEEIESAVVNRCQSGFVKFHDAASRVKAPPLWMSGVLDVALDTGRLLKLAATKISQHTKGSALMSGLKFVRCYVKPHRVTVEVEDVRTKEHKLFAARLFVDACGGQTGVAQQLGGGQSITHVCPAVGTIARGFVRGEEGESANFRVGEIMVSNEDARDHRQLLWEGFATNRERDEYATGLFFYDAVDSRADKSLLALFERYFESLPRYKRTGAQWRVMRPVFGYLPASHQHGIVSRKMVAGERVLSLGEGCELAGPLVLGAFGTHARSLQRVTHLLSLALDAEMLDAASLKEIADAAPRVAEVAVLADFLRPTPQSGPSDVNETLNAVMAALHELDEGVRRDLFQDRLSFSALKNLLGRTAKLYPRIFQRMRERLGARGTLWWLFHLVGASLSERRKEPRTHMDASASSLHGEMPAEKFARFLEFYRNENGAGPV